MLIQAQVGKDIRKRVELWITTQRARQEAAHLHIDALAPVVNDRSEALLEKIEVDSARAAMLHMKRPMKFAGQVLINDRPATTLTLNRLSPDLIKNIELMKRADSANVIKVFTKDH
jgi:hypothetical protein